MHAKSVDSITPRNPRAQDLFIVWLSMPLTVRSMPDEELKRLGFDIDDEEFKLLVGAKTMTEIAKALDMTRQQLWKRKNDPEVKRRVEELNMESNVMRFKKDIDFAFAQKTIAEADAAGVMAFYKLHAGFKERSTTEDPDKLTTWDAANKCLFRLRLVTIDDPDKQGTLTFLTNQLTFGATTVAAIYKERWQVELFFKAVKQNLKIKTFALLDDKIDCEPFGRVERAATGSAARGIACLIGGAASEEKEKHASMTVAPMGFESVFEPRLFIDVVRIPGGWHRGGLTGRAEWDPLVPCAVRSTAIRGSG